MKSIIVLAALLSSSAFATKEKIVGRDILASQGLVKINDFNPDSPELLDMAINKKGNKAYWLACSPPTGYMSLALPLSPTALMVTEVIRLPNGTYAKRPGASDKTVGYKIYSFFECAITRASSMGASMGQKTLLIKEGTPLIGAFGLREFEVK